MKRRVTFDFETRSACDLKKSGAYKYSLDPSTKPTCLAFKEHGKDAVYLLKFEQINRFWDQLPKNFRDVWVRWIAGGYEFSAHNAFFETCIYKNILVKRYGWPDIPFDRFRCTAAKAAACALPRNLEGAGEAMELRVQKDKRGYVAMMATCKPTKQWNAWTKARIEVKAGKRVGAKKLELSRQPEPPVFLEYAHNPAIWETLYEYCRIDVLAEEQLDDALPDLISFEQKVWQLNQKINWRGVRVDVATAKKVVSIMAAESETRLKELDSLTMGLVTKPGARASILEFLALEGVELPDIRAKTVEDVLKGGELSPDMKRLLEIRQQLSKTSTKKFQAFIDRVGADDRIRDILLYCGASTGRDAGTGGVQLHNMARPVIPISKERPYAAIENVIHLDAGMLKLLYGDNLSFLFSSIIRNILIPSEGYELFVADFSKIEVAVLWWLARNWPGLQVLKSGKDPYIYQAAANTGKRYEDIDKDGDERQLGKAQILGAGFRMGWKRFKETAYSQYRLKLTGKQSAKAIKDYREANAAVAELWDAYEDAAVTAVERPGQEVFAGRCKFRVERGFLWVTLPSGRNLAYRSPSLCWRAITYTALEEGPNGEEIEVERTGASKKTFQFLGLDITKKNLRTEFMHGGIWAENITQAVARDNLMYALLNLENAGYPILSATHDEPITERKKGQGSIEEFTRVMCQRPAWADEHLPLDAKGWKGPRYRK